MNDPKYLIDHDVPVEKTRAGKFDVKQPGTTAMEKLFNGHTAASASMRLFHHPDDARFVPEVLRELSPLTMSLQGAPKEYTGEPYILPHVPKGRDDASGSVDD